MKETYIDKKIENISRKEVFRTIIDFFEIAIDYYIVLIDIFARLINLKEE